MLHFALLLVVISGLITGCAGLSSVPTPPDSPYPADIIGRVTIAKKIVADGREHVPLRNDCAYWIVEVSVKNKEYQNPVTFVWNQYMSLPQGVGSTTIWSIIYNDKLLSGTAFKSLPVTVPKGQSGNIILSFEVIDINPSDAQICYKGQEPFSYGTLITGDTVAVYDWDLKKVTQAEVPPTKKEPSIPYGTYVYDARVYTSTITLNSDGTYMTDGFSSLSKDVGEYNITSDYITFISEANKKSDRYKYRYSNQFKCLYIYLVPDDDNPLPFYKR